jgi:hypothetical protein
MSTGWLWRPRARSRSGPDQGAAGQVHRRLEPSQDRRRPQAAALRDLSAWCPRGPGHQHVHDEPVRFPRARDGWSVPSLQSCRSPRPWPRPSMAPWTRSPRPSRPRPTWRRSQRPSTRELVPEPSRTGHRPSRSRPRREARTWSGLHQLGAPPGQGPARLSRHLHLGVAEPGRDGVLVQVWKDRRTMTWCSSSGSPTIRSVSASRSSSCSGGPRAASRSPGDIRCRRRLVGRARARRGWGRPPRLRAPRPVQLRMALPTLTSGCFPIRTWSSPSRKASSGTRPAPDARSHVRGRRRPAPPRLAPCQPPAHSGVKRLRPDYSARCRRPGMAVAPARTPGSSITLLVGAGITTARHGCPCCRPGKPPASGRGTGDAWTWVPPERSPVPGRPDILVHQV